MAIDIVYTCPHCAQETTGHVGGSELMHGGCYHLTCTECGKEAEMYMAIYPIEPEEGDK